VRPGGQDGPAGRDLWPVAAVDDGQAGTLIARDVTRHTDVVTAGDTPSVADASGADPADGPADPSGVPLVPMDDTCGIVLAGGRASRFGGDKLSAREGSRSLLALAVEALSAVCEEVVVAVAAGYRPPPLPPAARLVTDPEPYRGPVMGLLSGAMATDRRLLVVAGGDMPALVPDVLRQLLAAVATTHQAAVLGLGPECAVQPLPLALRRSTVLERFWDPGSSGGRSLLWLLRSLDCFVIPEDAWRIADPLGMTLRDVDRPEDLSGA